jgi:hypothetical protein
MKEFVFAPSCALARTLLTSLSVCALGLQLGSSASAQSVAEHAFVPVAFGKASMALLDTKSLSVHNGLVTAWTLWVDYPSTPTAAGELEHMLSLDEYNCRSGESASKAATYYDDQGDPLSLPQPAYSFAPITPGSMAEGVLKAVRSGWRTDLQPALSVQDAVVISLITLKATSNPAQSSSPTESTASTALQ